MTNHVFASAPSLADTGRRIGLSLFASLGDRFDRYRAYRRSVAELEACSDRDLADLGIYRCDIRRLSLEAAYGKDV